jgi:hypothetical protein
MALCPGNDRSRQATVCADRRITPDSTHGNNTAGNCASAYGEAIEAKTAQSRPNISAN